MFQQLTIWQSKIECRPFTKSHLQSFLICVAFVAVMAWEAVPEVAVVSLDVGQKGEFLEEEFVAHETLKGLTVVSSSKMDLKKESLKGKMLVCGFEKFR